MEPTSPSLIALNHKPKRLFNTITLDTKFLDHERTIGIKLLYSIIYDYYLYYKSFDLDKVELIHAKEILDAADVLITALGSHITKDDNNIIKIPSVLHASCNDLLNPGQLVGINVTNVERLLTLLHTALYKTIQQKIALTRATDTQIPETLIVSELIEGVRNSATRLVDKLNTTADKPAKHLDELMDNSVTKPLGILWGVYAQAKNISIDDLTNKQVADEVMIDVLTLIRKDIKDHVPCTAEQKAHTFYSLSGECGVIEHVIEGENQLCHLFGLENFSSVGF